jgi:5-formyltetrahydrofolate cyclo-ligase
MRLAEVASSFADRPDDLLQTDLRRHAREQADQMLMPVARAQLDGAQKRKFLDTNPRAWRLQDDPITAKAMIEEPSNLERLFSPMFLLALLVLGGLAAFEILALVLSS